MPTLIAISIACGSILILLATAVFRNIFSSRKRLRTTPSLDADFAHHLFSAVEQTNLREVRPVPPQTVKQVFATKAWNQLTEISSTADASTPHPQVRAESSETSQLSKRL